MFRPYKDGTKSTQQTQHIWWRPKKAVRKVEEESDKPEEQLVFKAIEKVLASQEFTVEAFQPLLGNAVYYNQNDHKTMVQRVLSESRKYFWEQWKE